MDSYIQQLRAAIEDYQENGNATGRVPVPSIVHATSFPPTQQEDGSVAISSAFHAKGGYAQREANFQDGGQAPSVHFSVNERVHSHVGGTWDEAPYTVYAPMLDAIAKNGLPETVLTADMPFPSTDKPVSLPGAIVVQKTPAQELGTRFWDPDSNRIANGITADNRADAAQAYQTAITGMGLADNGRAKELLSAVQGGYPIVGRDLIDIQDTLAMQKIHSLPGYAFGMAGGAHDGFLDMNDHRELANQITAFANDRQVNPDYFMPKVGRHAETAGDTFKSLSVNREEYAQIASDSAVHPVLRAHAEQLPQTELFQSLRDSHLLNRMRSSWDDVSITNGEQTANVAALLAGVGDGSMAYESDSRIGPITPSDMKSLLPKLSDDEFAKVGLLAQKHLETLQGLQKEGHEIPVRRMQGAHDAIETIHNEHARRIYAANTLGSEQAPSREQTLSQPAQAAAAAAVTGATMENQMSDAAIFQQLGELNRHFETSASLMESFNQNPAVQTALSRAKQYGMPASGAIHEAMDNNPALKKQFMQIHQHFHDKVQPAMDRYQELSGKIKDPDLQKQAHAHLFAHVNRLDKAQQDWPDRHDVQNNAQLGQKRAPTLRDHIQKILQHLKEILTGKRAPQTPEEAAKAQQDATNKAGAPGQAQGPQNGKGMPSQPAGTPPSPPTQGGTPPPPPKPSGMRPRKP